MIRSQYGQTTTEELKSYSRQLSKIAHLRNQKYFLLRCRSEQFFPKYLNFNMNRFGNQDNYKLKNITTNFKRKLLSLSIEETFYKLQYTERYATHIAHNIKNLLPPDIFEKFFYLENLKYEKLFNRIKQNNLKKFTSIEKQNLKNNLPTNTENTVINLTNKTIPDELNTLLQLGPKFNLPNTEILPIKKIISNIESAIIKIDDPTKRNEIRSKVSNILTNFKNKLPRPNLQYSRLIKKANQYIKSNRDILILNADKTNKTVIMSKFEYEEKIKLLLSDNSTYKQIKKDPTLKIQTETNSLINEMYKTNQIDKITCNKLKTTNSIAPKLYGLPKIHKINNPLRPIISNIDSPTYKLSKYLSNILSNIVGQTEFNIKDSFQFKKFIDSVIVPTKHKLISLDIISLFTNIPIDFALDCINEKWPEISKYTNINYENFKKITELCLNSTYFTWNSNFYTQIYGTAMGSPISSVIADIVLDKMTSDIINKLQTKPIFFKRFVDDCLLLIPEESANSILDQFNKYHPKIQYTIEIEKNNSINFLDMTITKKENHLQTNWFQKSIKTKKVLNYLSNHPIQHKNSTIFSTFNRALSLSQPNFRQQHIISLKKNFINNNYPINIINKNIKKAIHSIYHNKPTKQQTNMTYVSLPYIQNLSEQLNHSLKKFNIKIAHKPTNTIKNQFYSKLKDKTPLLKKSNIIYEIPCLACEGKYIGQSKRHLETRINEHKRSIKHLSDGKTGLSNHTLETGHKFNFNNVKILDIENNTTARKCLEMIYIKQEKNNVNFKQDIEGISQIYCNLI